MSLVSYMYICWWFVGLACYGIVSPPTSGVWYCRKCESQERAARVVCVCPRMCACTYVHVYALCANVYMCMYVCMYACIPVHVCCSTYTVPCLESLKQGLENVSYS